MSVGYNKPLYILPFDHRASFQTGDQRQVVEPGTVIFVERNVEHRFIDVMEDLTVLVFFAPAEGSLAPR